MKDILEGKNLEIKVLDHGFVKMVDCMPRLSDNGTGDYAIVQAARVSYGDGTKTVNEDRGLIRYLMRHSHTSPFEQVEVKFHIKLPLFVLGQIVRHRTANLNVYSGRYSVMSDDFYLPDADRIVKQSTTNKQGSGESFDEETQDMIRMSMKTVQDAANDAYRGYIEDGVAREIARIELPQSNYTEMYWKMDLHNLFHFLKLRLDSHAQYEIRVFAEAIYDLIKPLFPLACEAFEDYKLNAMNMSSQELELCRMMAEGDPASFETYLRISSLTKREQTELKNKLTSR